jgi:hypothetical protein
MPANTAAPTIWYRVSKWSAKIEEVAAVAETAETLTLARANGATARVLKIGQAQRHYPTRLQAALNIAGRESSRLEAAKAELAAAEAAVAAAHAQVLAAEADAAPGDADGA